MTNFTRLCPLIGTRICQNNYSELFRRRPCRCKRDPLDLRHRNQVVNDDSAFVWRKIKKVLSILMTRCVTAMTFRRCLYCWCTQVSHTLYTPVSPVDRVGCSNAAASSSPSSRGAAATRASAAPGERSEDVSAFVAARQKGTASVDREQASAEKTGCEPDQWSQRACRRRYDWLQCLYKNICVSAYLRPSISGFSSQNSKQGLTCRRLIKQASE